VLAWAAEDNAPSINSAVMRKRFPPLRWQLISCWLVPGHAPTPFSRAGQIVPEDGRGPSN
jgi:hypothetical protein